MRWLAVLAFLSFSVPSHAEPSAARDVMHPMTLKVAPADIISHVLYLNKCTGGCKLTSGNTDARTDHTDILPGGQTTLSAFSGSSTQWDDIVTCVTNVMKPFNITVTDTDPGNVDHFEVMIAGHASEMQLPQGVLGIADYLCQAPGQCSGTYIPNALVFDYADDWLQMESGSRAVTDMCGTAAQEIAHAWTLDHATPASDPMTYNPYMAPLNYQDGAPCGSDCYYQCPSGGGTCNAFGVPCSGQTHACLSTGQATQDEVKMITALFGPHGAKAPTVKITSPSNGGGVQSGQAFKVTATCDTGDGVDEIDLAVDGTTKSALTTSPATFTGPADLADGSHTITVTCQTKQKASASATISVLVGNSCMQDSDCPMDNICYQQTCVAGPSAMGGIGATCMTNADCQSGSCASDGTKSTCVIPCDPSNDQCPNGFGCLPAGQGGVCWAGAEKGGGGGCCDAGSSSGPAGPILLGLGLGLLVLARKRGVAEA
jgi:hypothetical protein